ncbi:MBL fold metallo-hydrolase [Neobacillus drentensis]|uniref:MBL fold metallo-hydrolase n=1 Tax=Neobacillus drentensis TaxID=220684 RepID=UPI00286770D3|nr:MBL fold metallo-hydrolase [Neobacillus drentensis]MDR7236395.1 glyoxylase-like metal-dependent hydrolase (beta-lactamase superfamily II) [Neobacillus drentensis]
MHIINEGIGFMELCSVVNNMPMVFRPTVIWDDKDVILIDTGYPGEHESLRENLEKVPAGRLTKIIITHQDYDHLGSLCELISGFNLKIEVYAHELTRPYIQGEKALIKTGIKVPGIQVEHTISDGEVLPFCGGISVIFTPGHTPDHISLYHHSSKTLISGDALTADQGQLQYPNKKFTLDMEQAIDSLNKFMDYEMDHVICFHGGLCSGQIKERISKLA